MTFQVKDHYFFKAKKDNYLARSIYKLEEIDLKYKIIKGGDTVIDLGYYPGSWVQYTAQKVGANGKIVGLDIKPVNKKLLVHKNVLLFEQDIFGVDNLDQISLSDKAHVLLSDMAPNTTGIRSVDQDRSLALVEKVFSLMNQFLKPGGNFVIKVFDSAHAQKFLKEQKKLFAEYQFLKPQSTRKVSKEFFVVGKKFSPM